MPTDPIDNNELFLAYEPAHASTATQPRPQACPLNCGFARTTARATASRGRRHNFFGRQLAAGYAAGRARIRRLNADRARFIFLCQLAQHALRSGIWLSRLEIAFITRLLRETNHDVPELFCGDANICDSLRRQYEPRLFFNRGK